MSPALFSFLARRHLVACLACCLPPVLVGALVGILWPIVSEHQDGVRALVSIFQDFLGGRLVDLFSVRGYFQFPFHHPLTLLSFAIAAGLPALGLPAGERASGGLELLLSTSLERGPMIRTVLLFQAMVAPIVACAPLLGVWIGSHLAGVSGELPIGTFAQVPVQGTLMVWGLGATATLISVAAPDLRAAAVAYGAFAFLGALARVASEMWEEGWWIQTFTPLGWYRPPQIVQEGALRLTCLAASILWIAGCGVWAVVAEGRRKSA